MGDELIEVYAGAHATVLLTKGAAKKFAAAKPKGRAQVHRWMREFGDRGPARLNNIQYKFEQRISVAGKDIGVWAFKGYQLRVYGALDGNRWIGTAVVEKKAQKADMDVLQRAAKTFALHSEVT